MFECPAAEFTIVSGDHDFDPLVAHFRDKRRVSREPDFSALPIFGAAQGSTPVALGRPAAVRPATSAPNVPAPAAPPPDLRQKKIDSLVASLTAKTNRPKTRERLLHHINAVFGQKLSVERREEILQQLLTRGIFTIPDGRKLVYAD